MRLRSCAERLHPHTSRAANVLADQANNCFSALILHIRELLEVRSNCRNRFVGIKSRGCYETPGGTLLVAAHGELEALCLDRDLLHFKQHVALKYAELVYFGLWFTPLREALDAFVAETQKEVSGTVTLKLYKGNVTIGGRESEYSLYRTDLSSFTMSESYDQKDAEGFIRILGLPARSRARLKQKHEEITK